jgi:integrase
VEADWKQGGVIMPRILLTEAAIRKAKSPRSDTTILWDTALPGFGCRLHPSGRKSFVLQYRLPDGQQRKPSLGPVGRPFSLADARDHARGLLKQVAQGRDPALEALPAAQRKEQRANTHKPGATTIEAVWAEFVRRHLEAKERSDSYIQHSEGHFRNYVLPRWRGRDISSITRKDVIALLDRIVDQGKGVTANRVLALVGRLFAWCVERDMLENNPASRVAKPGAEHRRDRVLDDRELALVWRAASEVRYPWGPFFQMLLLTGQRRSEVARMRWVDVRWSDAEWHLSASQTKAHRALIVPLSPLAQNVLLALPGSGWPANGSHGTWTFTTTGRGPIRNFDDAKNLIDASLGETVAKWNIHDIRRSVATGLAKLGVLPHVIEAVQNHAPQGISRQVYNRYSYGKEKREALELWAQHVAGLSAALANP